MKGLKYIRETVLAGGEWEKGSWKRQREREGRRAKAVAE